jgi:L-fuculokinase
MTAGIPVTAVFDIGKTNKKLLLYDKHYAVVYESNIQFEEQRDDDGDFCENLSALTSWMKQIMDDLLFDDRFHIKALNFSAYGASLVHLDKRGIPATSLYSYLKDYPEDLLDDFYHKYGSKEMIALQTASPPLGMLNAGLQLYWLKHRKPGLYRKIKCSLHLPQYCSYLITNKSFSEMTSIGCHTALWNFRKKDYHSWVFQENLAKHFPPVTRTESKLDIPLGKYRFCAGAGIHDSSAALLPYLIQMKEPFLLLSTGTWSITFNPFNEEPLTADELNKDCMAYISPQGRAVKASRLFLGNEHRHYEKKIARYFAKEATYYKAVKFDKAMVQKLIMENNSRKKFLPETMHVDGYLSYNKHKAVDLSLFGSYEEAYHQLNIDLVTMQAMAIETAMGSSPVRKICVSGDLCNNLIFIKLLASRFPDMSVYTNSLSNASALGAALVMHKSWNTEEIGSLFELNLLAPERDIAMMQYELV